ncbi:MAG: HAMP domain-containing sensor histidine kinase [Candidatus Aminicenantes bacterium]|nr:HAMP domain-containing sensor histidine kinase [Candidatus Aminicenantes bacterium]
MEITMNSDDTMFAPPEKATNESVLQDAETLLRNGLTHHFIHLVPSILVILNKQRQVVYKNQRLMDLLGASSDQEVLGKRPGELFNCIHAFECANGCGTTEFCSECGAVKAILKSQQDQITVEMDCRITSTGGNAYDLRVWASPYNCEGKDYTVFSLVDIRHEKRRHALERIFFHDINNLLSVLAMASESIDLVTVPGEDAESIAIMKMISTKLSEEVIGYQKLLQAEDGQLKPELVPGVRALELVDELVRMAKKIRRGRVVVRVGKCDDFVMTTDRTLLYRVLHNMVKNAVEASSSHDVVLIRCTREGSSGVFSVHNHAFMPRSTQLQVFQRSFSTKGNGRGIGTYSMKLFGEEYLKGKVWFSTSEDKGTTFSVSVPLSPGGD